MASQQCAAIPDTEMNFLSCGIPTGYRGARRIRKRLATQRKQLTTR